MADRARVRQLAPGTRWPAASTAHAITVARQRLAGRRAGCEARARTARTATGEGNNQSADRTDATRTTAIVSSQRSALGSDLIFRSRPALVDVSRDMVTGIEYRWGSSAKSTLPTPASGTARQGTPSEQRRERMTRSGSAPDPSRSGAVRSQPLSHEGEAIVGSELLVRTRLRRRFERPVLADRWSGPALSWAFRHAQSSM